MLSLGCMYSSLRRQRRARGENENTRDKHLSGHLRQARRTSLSGPAGSWPILSDKLQLSSTYMRFSRTIEPYAKFRQPNDDIHRFQGFGQACRVITSKEHSLCGLEPRADRGDGSDAASQLPGVVIQKAQGRMGRLRVFIAERSRA